MASGKRTGPEVTSPTFDATAVLVRPAGAHDLAAVADLMVRTYVDEGFVRDDSPYVAELADAHGRSADAELLVASLPAATERVVGTVTFCRPGTPWAEISRPGEAEFRMLAVESGSRRGGVGTTLVLACVGRARAVGARRLVISTTPLMRPAHRLYEGLGFQRTPDRDWSPRPGVDLWTYALSAAM